MKKLIFCICCAFLMNFVVSEAIDDSKYNDSTTLEFGLKDSKGNEYSLYHNVNNIKGFDSSNFEIVAQWKYAMWVKKEDGEFSVTWNNTNGAIVILKTNNSAYTTRRGIKVGDSISKIKEVYKDCSLWQTNYNGNVIIGFGKANMLEEEMMTLAFWTERGFVTSIEIVVGENESWINRN